MASLMGTVLAPIVLMWLTTRERRAEKLQDYARQDLVLVRTEEAARLLLASNASAAALAEEAAKLLVEHNSRVTVMADITNQKLEEIRIDVNSNLTNAKEAALSAKESELDAKQQSLILMVEIMDLKRASGIAPTLDVLDSIESAKQRISELNLALGEKSQTH